MEIPKHNLIVPPQHAEIELIDANETYLFGSRGSFKTTVGSGLFNIRRVFEMPRSTGVGVGITFNNLYENTVPPLKVFLQTHGFIEHIHFKICEPPPDAWPKPYLEVVDRKYKNTMTWYNGTVKQFISLRRKASANGVSAQWGDFDEAKFMDEKELTDEIFPIFRGNEKYFKNCSGYLSKFFATDKKADPVHINWLLKKRDLVDKKKVDVVITLQVELNKLKAEYNQAGINARKPIGVQIKAIETRLVILRSNLVYVAEINADDVREILGEKWYQDKRKTSKKRDWNIIYKNQDPILPGESFYPAWDENKHCYSIDNDIDDLAPLIISGDYQHTVAPLPIAQLATLPGSDKVSLNYVDEVYTLHPEGLRDAVKKFCERYKARSYRQIYFVYDHTAKGGRVDADEYYKIVVSELEKHDWIVTEVYIGQAQSHYQRYLDTIDWMENKEGESFDIRVNKTRCPKLIKSITGAAAKTVGKETKKDKADEIKDQLDQSETTHFSDAFDTTNTAVLKLRLIAEVMESTGFSFR